MTWRCQQCGPVDTILPTTYRDQRCPRCNGPLSIDTPPESIEFRCPRCAQTIDARVAQCPLCGLTLTTPRCTRCRAALDAARCRVCGTLNGNVLPLLGLRCPACQSPLEERRLADALVLECTSCQGRMIEHAVLDTWTADRAARAPAELQDPTPPTIETQVRYRRCPRCNTVMNRVNPGSGAKVIVDICKDHGIWFDPGELERWVDYARRGGLEAARQNKEAERLRERQERTGIHRAIAGPEDLLERDRKLEFVKVLYTIARYLSWED